MPIAPPNYGTLGEDVAPHEIQNVTILARPRGSQEDFFRFGDCDSASITTSVTPVQRKGKDGVTRLVVAQAITDFVSTLAIRAMQFSIEIRGLQLLGTPVKHTQAATETGKLNVKAAKVGGYYMLGALDVTDVAATVAVYSEAEDTYTPGAALPANSFRVVDQAAGIVELVGGAADGDVIQFTFKAPAIAASDNRHRIDFGSKTQWELELVLRGLSAIGVPYMFHIEQWNCAPGNIDLIGGDDFMGQDLTGALIAHNGKYGTWKQLAKTH